MTFDLILTLSVLSLAAMCMALVVLCGVAHITDRKTKPDTIASHIDDSEVIFLFDDDTLMSATPSAQKILDSAAEVGSDWSKLLSVFLQRFPTLQIEIGELEKRGQMDIHSRDGATILRGEWRNGLARLSLLEKDTPRARIEIDHLSIAAMDQELETLRATTEHVPFLVWRELKDGTVSWANAAYMSLADAQRSATQSPSWPPASLFDTRLLHKTERGDFKRLNLNSDTANDRIYEVFSFPVGEDTLYTAIPADRTVEAEKALCDFRQTLTKTFAHLTIGLVVFDRNRNLALFNPALSDLTALPFDFLSNKPTLTDFLDRLRDTKMMPEPKDYKTWRSDISKLESAATNGTYGEIWSLHGGMTYRVTGRPHPDGAIAFLFEDISAEMSLTRRFRAEIETGQAVFDSLDEAIAVFANDGTLLMANSAYTSLWGDDGLEDARDTGVLEATRIWHSKCAPNPIWSDVRDFVGRLGERAEWKSSARLWDGRQLTCRFAPLPGGQTLAGFSPKGPAPNLRPDTQPVADPRFVEM